MYDDDIEENELKKLRDELEELKKQMNSFRAPAEPLEPAEPEMTEPEVPIEIPEDELPEPEEPEDVEEPEGPEEPEEPRVYRRRRENRDWDTWGDSLGDYIGTFVEDIMEGVAEEIERSVFVHPRGPKKVVARRRRRARQVDTKYAASVMSALGNEHRLKVLDVLSSGGLYSSDLQENLDGIAASTLSNHLDVLEDVGLITQERTRGRYLITVSGRLAVNMAYELSRRSSQEED